MAPFCTICLNYSYHAREKSLDLAGRATRTALLLVSALTQDPFNNIVYPFESKYSIFIELFNKNIVQFSRKLEHGYLKGGSTEHSLKPIWTIHQVTFASSIYCFDHFYNGRLLVGWFVRLNLYSKYSTIH